jgi:hypothetical protein
MDSFGLFKDGEPKPVATYEGDYTETYAEQSLVKVLKKARTRYDNEEEVATIKLKPGFSVRKMGPS